MIFIKGKRYRHAVLDAHNSKGFEVIEIMFQCDQYADLTIKWIMSDHRASSGTKLIDVAEKVRIDSKHYNDYNDYYDIYH